MAEDQETTDNAADLTTDEKAELEHRLDGTGGGEEAAGGLQGVKANKKLLMIYGGGLLVLIIAIGVGAYFFLGEKEGDVVPLEEQAVEEEIIEKEEEVKIKKVKIKKVNIYNLEPFFLPIRDDGKETGRFISIAANLLLSNRVLKHEIDKVLPLVRENIYNILRRKRPSDFTLERFQTEERIKKQIMTACNAMLLGGTGTITDVFFTRFMVK